MRWLAVGELLRTVYLALGVFMLVSSVPLGAAVSAELRRRFMLEVAEDLALAIRLVNSTKVSVLYRLPEASEVSLVEADAAYTVRVAGSTVEVAYTGLDWSRFPPRACEREVEVSCGVQVMCDVELKAGDTALIEPASGGVIIGGGG